MTDDTPTSADLSSLADRADTSTGDVESQADSFDEGDGDYATLDDHGKIHEMDEGDADYATLDDHSIQNGLDPELSDDELNDPTADPPTEPQPWAPDETIRPNADDPSGGPSGTSPEVDTASGEPAQAIEQGERQQDARDAVNSAYTQQEARDAVNTAYAEAEADGVPSSTIESFEADAQQAINGAPSTTDAKEVEFEEPVPMIENEEAVEVPEQTQFSPDQQKFVDSSIQTESGTAYFDSQDREFIGYAQDLPPHDGEFAVVTHGSEYYVGLKDADGSWTSLDADQFADVLRDSGWDGEPVRLVSCNTGAVDDGFAQQLSDNLDTSVIAATDSVQIWREPDGTVQTAVGHYESNYTDTGEVVETFVPEDWVTFNPRVDTNSKEGK